MKRTQTELILKDLHKIVFLVGPRQSGKTWLAKEISKQFKHSVYLNYDQLEDRKIIKEQNWLPNTELLILDELHKMPKWKNYLKGLFDTKEKNLKILVTGSARLDTFRQSGDALSGRFFTHHLLPFSPAELKTNPLGVDLNRFIERSGFPEPFLAETKTDADRWRLQYIDGLIRNDVLDFERIYDFKALQLILDLLRSRVGSPISYTSLAEDVSVSPNTVKKYIQILENLFIIFRVTPFAKNIARSLIKEPKIYFYDTGLIKGDDGIKFENLMACCLIKHVFGKIDYEGKRYALHYLRTKEKREVDFCLVNDGDLELLIETKNTDTNLSTNLLYFSQKYQTPSLQIVQHLRIEKKATNLIQIKKAVGFLQDLIL